MIELEKHHCVECKNYAEEKTLRGIWGQCLDPNYNHEISYNDARTAIVMCPGFIPKEEEKDE